MAITIDKPTAECALQAVRQLPHDELERFKAMLTTLSIETIEEEEEAWHEASARSATSFFDDEETS